MSREIGVAVRLLRFVTGLTVACWGQSLAAQTLVLSLGDSARVQVAPGTKVTVPLTVNLSAAAGTSLRRSAGVRDAAGRMLTNVR
jgi:hypothetical protein